MAMKGQSMGVTTIRHEPFSQTVMKVVILYDGFACAASAKANVERAARFAGEALRGNVELCRLDILKQAAFGAKALEEAVDAHLIVVALFQAESLPVWLLDWLGSWAARRRVQDAGLAVFGGGNEAAPPPAVVRELSQFAARHRLSFIFDHGAHGRDESALFVRDLRPRENKQPLTLPDIFEGEGQEPHRHWGIIEQRAQSRPGGS